MVLKKKLPEPPYTPRKTSWLILIGEKHYKRMEVQPPYDYPGKLEMQNKNLLKLKKAINGLHQN